MSFYVGIDFGTTNSSIAIIGGDGRTKVMKLRNGYGEKNEIIRTQLHFNLNGNVDCEDVRVNQEPDRSMISLKRKIIDNQGEYEKEIDGTTYEAPQLGSLFLQQLLNQAEIEVDEINRLVLSVPANADEQFKSILEKAATTLGIEEVWFIDEPIAVFWNYNDKYLENLRGEKETLLIFDFGGGTLDVALMNRSENESILGISQKDNWNRGKTIYKNALVLGGDDFDEIIVKYFIEKGKEQGNVVCEKIDLAIFDDIERLKKLREQPVYKKLKRLAEMFKIKLSEQDEASLSIPPLHPKFDRIGIRGITLTQELYEQLSDHLWKKILSFFGQLENELEQKGLSMNEVNAVLLSGGSSNLIKAQDLLEELFPEARLIRDGDMQTSICQGNAIYCVNDGGILIEDSVNASYGLFNHVDKSTVELISASDSIGIKREKRVATTRPNQKNIEIRIMVNKGGDFLPLKKFDNEVKYVMKIKPLEKCRDFSRLKVFFEYGDAQKLKISAYDNHYREWVGVEEIVL